MLFNIIKNKIFFIVMLCYICVGFGSLAKAEELISVINIDDSVTLSIQQGNILVTGYALSNNPISEVNIYLDGNFLGKSNFGLERTLPSQYAVYPNYKNSGFSLEFNSRGYSDGEHQLKVESVDVNSTKINKVINIEIKNQRTLIMGQAIATKAQMIKYFQQNNNIKDINYINNFVSILSEEASIEGVRADVSFAQMMKETNFLKFTGDVREFQNNFAGLGATGPVPVDRNVPYGNVFPDIRIGIRAAIQHLKAYASKENLVQAVVDQRFSLVKRESAPYVEWLGIQENPYGGGWASSYNYGYDIVKMVNTLKNLQVNIATATITNFSISGSYYSGKNIMLDANGTATNGILYKFLIGNLDTRQWVTILDYSEKNTVSWTPIKSGNYQLVVQVKDKLSGKAYDDLDYKNINIQDEPSAKVTNFSISGSYYSGENITLVANGTATNGILYKFLIGNLDTKQWVTIQDYSEKNTVSWTPIKSGNYQLVVQVKDKLSSKTYDNFNYKNISVGKTIVLDAGHGGSDPGATGNGYEEADLNIQIVQKLGAKLQALGFNIMYTRQPGTDVYVSLQDRVKFANDNNADLFLSIHHDSSTSSTAQGTSTHYSSFRPAVETAGAYVTLNGKNYSVLKEVDGTIYYMDGSTTKTVSINDATAYDATPSEAAAKSEILAEELVNELSSLGVANRGSSDHNLYVTRWTTMPSVLVEMGFISNPDEIQKIANPSYQDAAAQKIADIIYKFFTNQ